MTCYMDLRISAASASVVKPVFDAAQRQLRWARLDVGPGELRLWGSSPRGVTGIDIQIPSEVFDGYDVSPGEWEINVETWWDAIREARMSDTVEIETVPNSFDSARDVPGIGADERRVLKDLDAFDLETIQNADPDDLVGETEYESYSDMKTAEVDREKAERIVQDANASAVAISVDGETVEDDLTVRAPRGHNSLPDVDLTASTTVNGLDFSRSFRPVEDVSEEPIVATYDDGLLIHGEGDADTVHATVDGVTDANEPGGSIYSADYLDSLRLSMARKGSTELTFHFPTIDDDELPLTADFEIEKDGVGADVTYYQAPKVRTENDAEPVEDYYERVHPDRWEPLDDVRLTATVDAASTKGWFSVFDSQADECRLHLSDDGISTEFVDSANVAMVAAEIGAEAWDSYSYSGHSGTLSEHDGYIGISQAHITDYLKPFRKTDDVTISVDADAQLAIDGPYFTVSMPTIDPDSVRQEPDFPNLDLPARAAVDLDDLTDAFDDADDVADAAALIVYDGDVYVSAEGDLEDSWTPLDTEEGDGYAASLFSLDYLTDYLSSIPDGSAGEIEFYAGREFPLVSFHDVEHEATDFTFMLAPRIQQDSTNHDVAGGDAMEERGMDPGRIQEASPLFSPFDEDDAAGRLADEPGEDLPSTPEEAADQVRDDDEDDDGGIEPYDPTHEWAEEAVERIEAQREEFDLEREARRYGSEQAALRDAMEEDPTTVYGRRQVDADRARDDVAVAAGMGPDRDPDSGVVDALENQPTPDSTDETNQQTDTDMDQDPSSGKFTAENNPANRETAEVKDALTSADVNGVVASNLARNFDSMDELEAAVDEADDVTNLTGVGDATADEVLDAVGSPSTSDGSDKQAATDGGTAVISSDADAAIETAEQTPPDQELDGPALKALKEAWGGYKSAASEGHEAVEETEEWREEHRGDAQEFAAIINDIRAAHGQEPIDFDGVEGIPEVDPVEGQITEESAGISLSFNWRSNPYDPTEDL